jgi:hypothetical protein
MNEWNFFLQAQVEEWALVNLVVRANASAAGMSSFGYIFNLLEGQLPIGSIDWVILVNALAQNAYVTWPSWYTTLNALVQHTDSVWCLAEQTRQRDAENSQKQRQITNMFQRRAVHEPRPSLQPLSSVHERLESHGDTVVHPPIRAMLTDKGLCPGVRLLFPHPHARAYPLHLHAFDSLSYYPEYFGSDGSLYVRSWKCHKMPRIAHEPCSACEGINTSSELIRLRERATGSMPITTNYRYYSFNQLQETLLLHGEEKNTLKLAVSSRLLICFSCWNCCRIWISCENSRQ